MLFSLPNMQKWLENKWTNCLNFEHTIFLSEKVIEFLLIKNSFKILKKFYFNEHSIFYATIKDEKIRKGNLSLMNEYQANKKLFMDMRDYYQRQIVRLNECITKSCGSVYLFGAHLFSQYLLYRGLDTQKIAGILDNNPNKQGKRLYGTKFFVFSPKILADKKASIILNAGVYNEEIKKDLLEMNKSLRIIDF